MVDQHDINPDDIGSGLEERIRTLKALEANLVSLTKENQLYLLQLHQLQEELERYVELQHKSALQFAKLERKLAEESKRLQQSNLRLAELQQKHQMSKLQLAEGKLRYQTSELQLAELQKQLNSRPLPLSERLARNWNRWTSSRNKELKDWTQKLRASGLFDESWYLQMYPNAAQAGLDPVEHYLRFGVSQGMNPGPNFDTRWYLEAYPDVTNAKVNPLLHYIERGKKEGRLPKRPATA